ncbi:MAG TPA: hypothetical protein VIV55_01720 [Flavobacterium sp.]
MNIEKIIAVIVLYKSNLEESLSFTSLLKTIREKDHKITLLVYNNSPDYWSYAGEVFDGISIINVNDSLNSGVSKAYNVAFTYAEKLDKSHVLLLDQDTKISDSFFLDFLSSYETSKNINLGFYCPMIMNKQGLISPANFFLFTTRKISDLNEGTYPLKGLAIINSGLIISTKLFQLVGGYNEKIKLDFSDFYFIKKVLQFEKNVVVFNSKCFHLLSSEEEVSFESALKRFDYYLEGAKYYNASFKGMYGLNLWIILRSLKISLKYKTTEFITKAFSSLLS